METTKDTENEDAKEAPKKAKKDTKLIPTEELAATNDSSCKENEKLSVFYKKDTVEPEPTSPAEAPTPSYSEPQCSEHTNASNGQSNFFSTLISFFAIIIAIAAIFIVKSGVPQVKTNSGNHEFTSPHLGEQTHYVAPVHAENETSAIDTKNSFLLLEREVDQLKFALLKENKLRLAREIDVIEYLSKKSNGKIKNQLENLGNNLSLLTQELDK